jgi:SAM-dependent methyltransferase
MEGGGRVKNVNPEGLCRDEKGERAASDGPSAVSENSLYWDTVIKESSGSDDILLWRFYMRYVYRCLLSRWFPGGEGTALKTDLFEEAVSRFNLLEDLGQTSVGVDCSREVARSARDRFSCLGRHRFVVGDLRLLPLRSGTFRAILSGSSLDHFRERKDIRIGLSELARVLSPGGTLVITFDNPHNPLVRLRNLLPLRLLARLRLVPYFVGHTCTRVEARRWLEKVGLSVTGETAVAHAPRAPAIWLASLAERLGLEFREGFLTRLLCRFEGLERWPTRYLTGYYIAIQAQKPRIHDDDPIYVKAGGRQADTESP